MYIAEINKAVQQKKGEAAWCITVLYFVQTDALIIDRL